MKTEQIQKYFLQTITSVVLLTRDHNFTDTQSLGHRYFACKTMRTSTYRAIAEVVYGKNDLFDFTSYSYAHKCCIRLLHLLQSIVVYQVAIHEQGSRELKNPK